MRACLFVGTLICPAYVLTFCAHAVASVYLFHFACIPYHGHTSSPCIVPHTLCRTTTVPHNHTTHAAPRLSEVLRLALIIPLSLKMSLLLIKPLYQTARLALKQTTGHEPVDAVDAGGDASSESSEKREGTLGAEEEHDVGLVELENENTRNFKELAREQVKASMQAQSLAAKSQMPVYKRVCVCGL